MDITEIKAHDLATAELMVALVQAERHANYVMDSLHKEAGDSRVNVSKRYGYPDFRWQMTVAEAQTKVADLAADPRTHYAHSSSDCNDSFYAHIAREAQAKLDALTEATDEIQRLQGEINAREDVFRANRWARFEAVPGGHIHNRNATCHTLRPTTRVVWIPTLSGDTEADAVAQYGPALCSHCFKNAPVEWIQQAKVAKTTDSRGEAQVLTLDEAKKIADEKAAAKAAREAKKAAREAKRAARG